MEAKGNVTGGITMGYGFVIAVAVVGLLLVWNGVKIVREYQRLVVFRLGRGFGPRGPGIVYLIPIIDKAAWVDLREAFLEIPAQTCITKDNAPISIDFLIYYGLRLQENRSDPSPRR